MRDKDIIKSIRAGNLNRPLRKLYKEFPKVERMATSHGLSKEQAQEVFNDSLLLIVEKINDPRFQLSAKLSTFLYGINRNLIKNASRKQKKIIQLEWSDSVSDNGDLGDYDFEKEEKLQQIEQLILQVSDKCRSIFELFYFKKKSMTEIAEILGYSSVNSAKTQKYKCIERAHKLSLQGELSNQKVNAS